MLGSGSGSGVGTLRRVADGFFAKEGFTGVKLAREARAGEAAPREGRFGMPRRGVDMQMRV